MRLGVLEVDEEELADDRTLGKLAEEEPTANPIEGGAKVEPWRMVWVETSGPTD